MIEKLKPVVLVLALVVGAYCLMFTMLDSSAYSQSIENRVKALETKTKYYDQKQRRITKTYKKKKTAAMASRPDCDGYIEFTFDPQVQANGALHVWIQADVKYSGDPGGKMELMVNSEWAFADAFQSGAGMVTLKKYRTLTAEPGLKLFVSVGPSNGLACASIITDATITMKTTMIEMIEPQ